MPTPTSFEEEKLRRLFAPKQGQISVIVPPSGSGNQLPEPGWVRYYKI